MTVVVRWLNPAAANEFFGLGLDAVDSPAAMNRLDAVTARR